MVIDDQTICKIMNIKSNELTKMLNWLYAFINQA